jgi:hypothetical protein
MPSFMTRVELHNATAADYEKLHEAMQAAGFLRVVRDVDGKWYHLPTAEYDRTGDYTTSQVLAHAKRAANSTGKSSGVTVGKYVELCVNGLKEALRPATLRR